MKITNIQKSGKHAMEQAYVLHLEPIINLFFIVLFFFPPKLISLGEAVCFESYLSYLSYLRLSYLRLVSD